MHKNLIALAFLTLALSGCASLRRDAMAEKAQTQMIGLSQEDVLACMGPPKKKAEEGSTEVWSYLSTDGRSDRSSTKAKSTYLEQSSGSHSKSFCTVNVVMKDGVVRKIHYLGPAATNFYNEYDQCGYAVAACVKESQTETP